MNVEQVTLIYFSPTGTTRKVLQGIAEGIGVKNVVHVDLTLPADGEQHAVSFSDGLVLLGAPVYAGRLPAEVIKRFSHLKADNVLAVPIVLYGNREFEDALLELKRFATELGFCPIAGGAFIGEHSFATAEFPIACGRPDTADIQKAIEFGANVKEKVAALQSLAEVTELQVPGNYPYKEKGPRPLPAAPLLDESACTVCGVCATVCPTGAIAIDEQVVTSAELCIRCCACIKVCPEGAREIPEGKWKDIARWLNENYAVRKEPQFFGLR